MSRKYIKQAQAWLEERLRGLCGRITPEKRLMVLLLMFGVFGFMAIYIFASAIYNLGKNQGAQIRVEHIKMLELPKSINPLNFNDNATKPE